MNIRPITKKRVIFIAAIVTLFAIIFIIRRNRNINNAKDEVTYEVKRGELDISVNSTGELESENPLEISMPSDIFKQIGIWEIKIASILPEGSIIDSGQVIAELDPSKISEKLSDVDNTIESTLTKIENAKADTSYDLSAMRDEIVNQQYKIKQLELALEQSKYESPTVIEQARMNLEDAQRALKQRDKSFELKKRKGVMEISQIRLQLKHIEKRRQLIMDALEQIHIKSPGKGMLVYQKSMMGETIKSGSTIGIHGNNVIAKIPDFSSMMSNTYVNEIEISKVKKGQKVTVGVDAFPDKIYTGEITWIANMGEELKGKNTKVFNVKIHLDSTDTFLRSGMTTSNKIIISSFPDTVFVPLEAVHNENNQNYVFKSSGFKTTKKQVLLGDMNDNFIIVNKGLSTGDKILLTIPENSNELEMVKL